MKTRFNLVLFFLLTGCVDFLNPIHPSFLDWNKNYIEKEDQERILSGYIYNGDDVNAIKVANECKIKYTENLKREKCLLRNGYKKTKIHP